MNSIQGHIGQVLVWHRVQAGVGVVWQVLSGRGIKLIDVIQTLSLTNSADEGLVCRHALDLFSLTQF